MKVGDNVILLHKGLKNKYKPEVYKVIRKRGSQVTAKRGDHVIIRNSSFYKVIPPSVGLHNQHQEREEYEVEYDDIKTTARPHTVDPQQREQLQQQEIVVQEQQQPSPNLRRGRPVRERRPPNYLKNYVKK